MVEAYGTASDRLGKALFGRPARLRLGMWISTLPGKPHTFTIKQFWDACELMEWPEAGRSPRSDLNRFVAMEMVVERRDLKKRGKRTIYWTKLPSPLWGIFEAANRVAGLAPTYLEDAPTDRAILSAQRGLLRLARGLVDD